VELVEAFLERLRVGVIGGIVGTEGGTELQSAIEEPIAAVESKHRILKIKEFKLEHLKFLEFKIP